MTTKAIKLRKLPSVAMNIRQMIPWNDGDFLAIPFPTKRAFYKYCTKTDQWIPWILSIHSETKFKIAAVVAEGNDLLLWTGGALFSVNISSKTIQCLWRKAITGLYQNMFLIGDYLHILATNGAGSRVHHHIINKRNGDSIGNPTDVNFGTDVLSIYRAKYSESRNSIIAFGRVGHIAKLTISEYSLSRNQWVKWKWVEALSFILDDYPKFVVTSDERYILMLRIERYKTDPMAICDVKLRKIIRTTFHFPVSCIWQAFMSRNKDVDDLLTFGFVRKSFHSPEFENVKSMPHHLIELIGKWMHNEYLNVMEDSFENHEANHFKINVDNILESVI